MAAIHCCYLPIALISLLLLSESLTISSADDRQDSNYILRRNMVHSSEHRRGDKDSGPSLGWKIIMKRGVRSGVITGHSTRSSSTRVSSFFNIGSLICFHIAFVFALLL
ncbi:unnamed protein product [Citrullus colocynthis]|uniref:Uncharacterized protein n=1 Tax=Citrullus colocynthis TaxID=252529 RepID=A0ABP0ZFT8_9ROSI